MMKTSLTRLVCLVVARRVSGGITGCHHPRTSLRSRAGLLFAFASLMSIAARAQSVHWERGDSGVAMSAQLVFENCAPDGEPKLPDLPNVKFARVGETSSTNIV